MPGRFWDKKQVLGPSAGLVQQHYVQARLEQLYRRDKELEKRLSQFLTSHPLLAGLKLTGDKWLKVYGKITDFLQAADLTINFKAESWFATENKYDSYTQTYERSLDAGGKLLLKDTDVNAAADRARVDDKVTFPDSPPGIPAAPRRGLMPGRQPMARIEAQMRFGAQAPVTKTGADGKSARGVESRNPYFNPKTKQIFAALNYGRRPHGSCSFYGSSYLVLHSRFKVNAIYFPCDTFLLERQGTTVQVGYHMLGAILDYADAMLQHDIIQSCYFGHALPDTEDANLLLEGHVFSALPFAGNLESIHVAVPRDSVYAANAKKFAAKHQARLIFLPLP
jgi:hypothetical protein